MGMEVIPCILAIRGSNVQYRLKTLVNNKYLNYENNDF